MRYKIFFTLVFISGFTFAQNDKNAVSFQESFHDYGIDVLNGKLANFDSALCQTLRLGYNQALGNSVKFSVGISNGFILNEFSETIHRARNFAVGLDATLILITNNDRIFRKEAVVSPYLTFGYQYFYINNLRKAGIAPNEFSVQYGLGINFKISKGLSMQLQSNLNQQLSEHYNTSFIHRIGITKSINWKKQTSEIELDNDKKESDYDGDGVKDILDKCPTQSGLETDFGCPKNIVDEKNKSAFRIDSLVNVIADLNSILESNKLKIDSLTRTAEALAKPKIVHKDTLDLKKNYVAPVVKKTVVVTPEPKSSEIEIVSEKTNSYYIVVNAALDKNWVIKEAKNVSKIFPTTKVIALENGFYRTAIYAGTTKQEAAKLVKDVINRGYKNAWVAFY